jgi:hypothetical protein
LATNGSAQRGAAKSGGSALDRLGDSLDAAQQVVKDLRRELSKGGRDVLEDLEDLLRDARKNLRRVQRTLIKDLEEVQKAAAGKRRAVQSAAPPGRRGGVVAPSAPVVLCVRVVTLARPGQAAVPISRSRWLRMALLRRSHGTTGAVLTREGRLPSGHHIENYL